jgi:hypothetical protein
MKIESANPGNKQRHAEQPSQDIPPFTAKTVRAFAVLSSAEDQEVFDAGIAFMEAIDDFDPILQNDLSLYIKEVGLEGMVTSLTVLECSDIWHALNASARNLKVKMPESVSKEHQEALLALIEDRVNEFCLEFLRNSSGKVCRAVLEGVERNNSV